MASDQTLRREIDSLGRLFGDVLRQFEGEPAFELVERVRALAKQFRDGDSPAGDQLAALLKDLQGHDLLVVIKAFSGFLELANLAEDRQRVRALRSREAKSSPAPRRESIRAAILSLRDQGFSAEQVDQALAAVDIELVFTAHPTEAKRKSLRSKLREIRLLLAQLDKADLLPREQANFQERLRSEIVKLWQTDLVRPLPPTVMEEVQRGLSFQPVLWDASTAILGELRDALEEGYPSDANRRTNSVPRILRFGSWMGGDRDGHPHVTPETTEETVLWLRKAGLDSHRRRCADLIDSLSMSCDDSLSCPLLLTAADAAALKWPDVATCLARLAPKEGYRRWLRVIQWRLQQTANGKLHEPPLAGEYASAAELASDVGQIAESLQATGNSEVLRNEIQPWLDQIATFGFCTARLDIRQHAAVYRGLMEEIWRSTQFLAANDPPLDEQSRQRLLLETLPIAPNLSPVGLSGDARRTLNLFRLLRRIARRFGMEALGGHISSMTTSPSDLLTVLWLWKWSERTDHGDDRDAELRLPIVPLFETIDDLQHATDILTTALDLPPFREHVRALGDRQMVMIGYSDSTKDGGYLAAAWALQCGQIQLHKAAADMDVDVTFFHGRGGSLGRGGGPAARAILSLPSVAFDGSLRLTEQGEVLAERYDDPHVAHRHLEQVVWSVLMASTHDSAQQPDTWRAAMQSLSATALQGYRQLVDHADFVPFFRTATPIAAIEGLKIGSRPAKRKRGDRIEDLRAIPWVFSWTQCRCLLPAWYGLGTAVEQLLSTTPDATDLLCDMYENWPFFRATIDNSTLAVAKSNLPVFRRYAALAWASEAMEIADMLYDEFERTRQAILTITGCDELLDDIPWLKRSILVRNGYVDPLNFVQIELMRRAAAAENPTDEQAAELNRLTQRAIKGVAAGMRTTG